MAPNPNLLCSNGLPVCLSGITIPIAFSTEIEDHDRRRKVFKEKIFGVRKVMAGEAQLEMRSNQRISHYLMRIVDDDEDLAVSVAVAASSAGAGDGDLSCLTMINTNCTAKAA